jgi:hypothetical protein
MALIAVVAFMGAVLPFYLAKRWGKWWLALVAVPLGVAASVGLSAAVAAVLNLNDPTIFPVGTLFGKVVGNSAWSLVVSPITAFIGWRKARKAVGELPAT